MKLSEHRVGLPSEQGCTSATPLHRRSSIRPPGLALALALLGLAAGCASTAGHIPVPLGALASDRGRAAEDLAKNEGRSVARSPGSDLSGATVRIIYVERREADAQEAAARLRQRGAEIHMFETSDSGNGAHIGKVYVKTGFERFQSRIISLVSDIEPLEPIGGGVGNFDDGQDFNLWIVR